MIPYLQVEGLTRYWGEVALFEDLNFTIAQGQKVALIARNGAGKTTLLDTIMGKDLPDDGKVIFTNDITIGYLNQNPVQTQHFTVMEEVYNSTSEIVQVIREYEEAIEGSEKYDLQEATEKMDLLNAWDFELKIKQILSQLKITNFDQLIGELSGGQQKRVALANVLINEPDFLILDEPTNHLDLDMIEWLEEYLKKMKSTLFMVTHDRYFLDRVCNEILELDNNTIYRYKGNYSYFIEKRAIRQDNLRAEVEKARNLMRTEQEWMRRMPKARSTKAKYRVDSFADLKAKASQNLNETELALNIKASRLGKKIIDIYHLSKSFGDLKVLNDFSYKFAPFEKIGIVGDNGTGKSTFLNLITGAIPADSGKLEIGETVKFGYYRQDGIQFSPEDKVLDVVQDIAEFIDLGKGNQWSASQLLTHFLFSYDIQHAQVEKLSGGEKRRLYLCTVLMQNPNFLILDEPTNDLDIMTLNVLEDYLQNFNGCVLIVSHDRYFMDKIVEHVFAFEEEGNMKNFPGNYSIYRQYKDEKDKAERQVMLAEKKETVQEKPKQKNNNKLTFNEKREFELLEKEIEELETEKSELETAMNSGELNHELLLEKSKRFNEAKDLLDEKELRWLELSEKD
ncbi:MAG: ABC-F family ATP-binding cassette domain-containing protein [Prolixibacteraceae bacterium]|jgi:ATP-binding cassette subfamily F protein uup|nr:ABC-F family ATP-binding cassette domain-containing protein [Prolixibacteraceae bacterium]